MPLKRKKKESHGRRAEGTAAKGNSQPEVVKCMDQDGQAWLRVSYHGSTATGSVADLLANEKEFFSLLNMQGVLIVTQSARNRVKAAAEQAKANENVYVAKTSGWHGSRFLRAGEPIPAKISGQLAIDGRPTTSSTFASQGSFDTWKSEVRRLANGQALPTFVLASAFVPLLPRLVPGLDDNPGFELCGPTTLGKSILLKLAASVHGSPASLVRRWDTTVNGLERHMAEANDSLLLLDEASQYLESGGTEKRHTLARAMFKLAHGTEKERHDRPAARYRFAFLSTSNFPLTEVTFGLAQEEREAIAVRVATIPAAASQYGVFDQLPTGCATSKSAADELVQLACAHYGHAARAFTAEFERRTNTRTGQALIKHRFERNLEAFRRQAGLLDALPAVARASDKFALAYVAAKFAWHWKILPLDWIGSQIVKVYRIQAASAKQLSPTQSSFERVVRYIEQHRLNIIDLRDGGFLELDEVAVDAAPGFLVNRSGHGLHLMMRKTRWNMTFGADSLVMLRELKHSKRLWINAESFQCQAKIRANKPKDRLYAVRLDHI